MSSDLTLYHFANAFSFCVNVVLHWTGQSANVVKPANSMNELPGSTYVTNINPAAAVPSLVLSDGSIITQNLAILHFLAKKSSRYDLVGGGKEEDDDDLFQQTQVLLWCTFFASDLHYSCEPVFYSNRYTTSTDSNAIAEVKAAAMNKLKKNLTIFDNHMKDRVFVVSNHKTIADAYAYAILRLVLGFIRGLSEELPSLQAFNERMVEDDGAKFAMRFEDQEMYGMA